MSGGGVALTIVGLSIAAVTALGAAGARGLIMNPEAYILAGRSLGTLFTWLLMAGEIYTSFTFLGAAGWAYGKGAPAFYILCYGPVAYVISYFLLPPLWRVAKRYGLLTGPDFFAVRYRSRPLGVLVACVGVVFLVPYVTLQLTGLQILLTIAGRGAFDATVGVGLAFVLTALFVFVAGLRGLAWASVVKDAAVLAAVAFAGIWLPWHIAGSPARLIHRVLAAHPGWMTLAPGGAALGTRWFVSTVLLTACGFWVWPQSAAAAYAARSDRVLQRNAILMPLYNILLVPALLAGFAALAVLPGLRGPAADQSFMLVIARDYPAWVLGLVAAAGCLAALIPASAQLLGAASVLVKNVLGDWLGVATTDGSRTAATRWLVAGTAALALWLWLHERTTLVNLLLVAYNGITQFFPGVVAGLVWRRATAWGVAAGILSGLGVLAAGAIRHAAWGGLNAGFVALAINVAVCVAVSLVTRPAPAEHLEAFAQAVRTAPPQAPAGAS
jgi:SSS family solute:Na+ symporter